MPGRDRALAAKALFALLTLLLLAGSAKAYVDPGAGPEFIGYFMSLVAWLGAAVTGALLWPIYALIRRFRSGGAKAPAPASPPPAAAERPPEEVGPRP